MYERSADTTSGSDALPTAALDYELPEALIATRPAEPRDSARMLIVHRSRDEIEHRIVRDLPEYLDRDDLLVFNNTAVAPARLVGRRADTGGRVEGLFLEEDAERCWRVMLKSGSRLRIGHRIELRRERRTESAFALELVDRDGSEWIARVDPAAPAHEVLDAIGSTPLPPYILRARNRDRLVFDDEADRAWYQTVYADASKRRSVAAPTAGLHFTPELLAAIDARGIERRTVTLHVGPGTFKPIEAETIDQHVMHSEVYEVPPDTLAALREAGQRRVIAVGTTTVRTLESLPNPLPPVRGEPIVDETDLLIAPSYAFVHVDGMLTNFHLPRSTLLALVGAMLGLDRLLAIYREAIQREYRFYSYGDAMLILP
jgi:S-adenosylmethionine:tRNA ribosyltransferase-isomerase